MLWNTVFVTSFELTKSINRLTFGSNCESFTHLLIDWLRSKKSETLVMQTQLRCQNKLLFSASLHILSLCSKDSELRESHQIYSESETALKLREYCEKNWSLIHIIIDLQKKTTKLRSSGASQTTNPWFWPKIAFPRNQSNHSFM